MLSGRRVVLGVSGSIAAYKAADLARRLVRVGAEVTAVLTENACRFITPLTLRTLTQRPVVTEFFSDPQSPVPHISLAQWADLICLAPATADLIARAAQGRADDLLAALILDTRAPVLWAPAMNTRMWENFLTQENVQKLTSLGHHWVHPASGDLACGETGKGRLAEVEDIVQAASDVLSPPGPWSGQAVLITAGPTREPWDAIRYLSNRSSGKMGFALAAAAAARGARVTLVSGPVDLAPPPGVRLVSITTAREMHAAVLSEFPDAQVIIAAAAVADFRPAHYRDGKMKKQEAPPTLELVPNPDILLELGKKKEGRILVGFAAEDQELVSGGRAKREKKNLDLIVANRANGADSAFGAEAAAVTLIDAQNKVEEIPRQSKEQLAGIILDRVEKLFKT